jgi:hypothetical protein
VIRSRFLILAGLCYAAVMGALLFGLYTARNSANQNFSTSDARRDWDDWRKSTETSDHTGRPVQRSIPRSQEPPTLVLLRDHFGVCAAASICITSALFWTVAILLRGVASGPSFVVDYGSPSDRRVK